jgi:hypothetical protein
MSLEGGMRTQTRNPAVHKRNVEHIHQANIKAAYNQPTQRRLRGTHAVKKKTTPKQQPPCSVRFPRRYHLPHNASYHAAAFLERPCSIDNWLLQAVSKRSIKWVDEAPTRRRSAEERCPRHRPWRGSDWCKRYEYAGFSFSLARHGACGWWLAVVPARPHLVLYRSFL